MEKLINLYETMFIVNPQINEEDLKATVSKFTTLISENGSEVEVAEWGKRRLSYPINDINEGYYVLVNYKSQPSFIAELERLFGINENIMRSLTLKLDEKKLKKTAAAKVVKTEAAVAVETTTEEA